MTTAAALGALGVAAVAYLIGMFPTARLVARRIGRDPTCEGSGNPGASNMYRIGGRLAGLVVLAGDMAKGAAPTLLALLLWGRPAALAAWLGAVVGHVWPVASRFRGGKGVATAGGGAWVLDPVASAACLGVFIVIIVITHVAALGSLSLALTYPAGVLISGWPVSEVAMVVVVMAIMILRHRSNISRLLRGTELGIEP